MKTIRPQIIKEVVDKLCAQSEKWRGEHMDLGTIGLHEALLIRSIRDHRCKGCDVLVRVEADDKNVYSVHWGSPAEVN